jgi:glucuronate isomerase
LYLIAECESMVTPSSVHFNLGRICILSGGRVLSGTPTGIWLAHELHEVFGIRQKLTGVTAQAIYDELVDKLARPAYRPRALFKRFKIEVLCTTDAASDSLGWRAQLDALSAVVGREITTAKALISALEERRAFFKHMGAAATDHGVESPYTVSLPPAEAEAIFARALRGTMSGGGPAPTGWPG